MLCPLFTPPLPAPLPPLLPAPAPAPPPPRQPIKPEAMIEKSKYAELSNQDQDYY